MVLWLVFIRDVNARRWMIVVFIFESWMEYDIIRHPTVDHCCVYFLQVNEIHDHNM